MAADSAAEDGETVTSRRPSAKLPQHGGEYPVGLSVVGRTEEEAGHKVLHDMCPLTEQSTITPADHSTVVSANSTIPPH